MGTRAELKSKAKEQIKGNIGILFLCCLVVFVILIALFATLVIATLINTSLVFVGSILYIGGFLCAPAFVISIIKIFLALTEGIRPKVADVFKGFSIFGKTLWLHIIMGVFIFLWSLLLIVPGIIKSFSYSMAAYILAENPNMTAREALNESKIIMKGHKAELFILYLSFILWGILSTVTCGIASIYVGPYIQATITNFYLAIKQKPQAEQIEATEALA